MLVKVVKFGGSSLADAAQFQKVAAIIKADPERRYVVPSAPGKRFREDTKVTDMLYACYERAARGAEFDGLFAQVRERYDGIIRELGMDYSLDREFAHIQSAFVNKSGRDYAASRGEYLNGKILAAYLGYDFIDASRVVFFNDDGSFNDELTHQSLRDELSRHERAVIPGFYGSMPNDTIKTFSRGGSDVTGSLVARAAGAVLYENWTDVSGFLVADPRIVPNPKQIKRITYRELRELSYMGATVLHEDAIFPVRQAGIPINIKNTNVPSDPGTMIVPESGEGDDAQTITGIAGKKGFSILHIEKDMMNQEIGFGLKVLEVLEEREISFEHLPSGIDTMSIVVATEALEGQREELLRWIKRRTKADLVELHDGIALIAVVGRGMLKAVGTAARAFSALAGAGINIRMIDQGSSELNIIAGIDEDHFEDAIRSIYKEFIGE